MMRGYFSFCGKWFDVRNLFCLLDNLSHCRFKRVCDAHDRAHLTTRNSPPTIPS